MANIVIIIHVPGRKPNDDLVEDIAGEVWESLDANLPGSTTARVEVLPPLVFADSEKDRGEPVKGVIVMAGCFAAVLLAYPGFGQDLLRFVGGC